MVEKERDSILETSLLDTGAHTEWSFFYSLYYTIQTVTTVGFGDIYIHSPQHAALNIAPVISTFVTAFCIALFAKVFSRLQAGVEKKGNRKILKARKSVAAFQMGVLKIERPTGSGREGREGNVIVNKANNEHISEV